MESMNTTIAQLAAARQTLLDSAAVVRKAAEAVAPKTPRLDESRVRSTFEDMVAVGLAKKAEIEAAVQAVMADPNTMCDVVRNLGSMTVAKQAAPEAEAEAPGKLVTKTAASAADSKQVMSQRFVEVQRTIAAKRAAAGK
jgi:hypothetical protein